MKEYSDSYLNKMWRLAVLKKYKNKCFFCGISISNAELECHHLVKRKNLLLRWDYRNGIAVCKYPHDFNKPMKTSCHQYAETPVGRLKIAREKFQYDEYFQERIIPFKQWLLDNRMSKAEFKLKMYNELKEIIEFNT